MSAIPALQQEEDRDEHSVAKWELILTYAAKLESMLLPLEEEFGHCSEQIAECGKLLNDLKGRLGELYVSVQRSGQ